MLFFSYHLHNFRVPAPDTADVLASDSDNSLTYSRYSPIQPSFGVRFG